MMEKSFAQFQADGDVVGDVRELERARARVKELSDELGSAGADVEGLINYLDLRSAISAGRSRRSAATSRTGTWRR